MAVDNKLLKLWLKQSIHLKLVNSLKLVIQVIHVTTPLLKFTTDTMSYSSIDPEGYPGTQEFQDWEEERARRMWHERLAYMEEVDEMNLMFPYN